MSIIILLADTRQHLVPTLQKSGPGHVPCATIIPVPTAMVPAVPIPKIGSRNPIPEMPAAPKAARPPATIPDARTPGQLLAHVLKICSQLQVGLSNSAGVTGLVMHR